MRRFGLVMSVAWIMALLWTMFTPVQGAYAQEDKGFASPQYLAETQWLEDNLDTPGLRIVDLRPLNDYKVGHIRNAVHLEIGSLRTTVNGLPGMMVSPGALEEALRAEGVGTDSLVVAYDNLGGLFAARFFMTLRRYGHNAVKVLDGGIRKWVAEDRQLTTETPFVSPADFRAGFPTEELADSEWILKNLNNPNVVLVDARSAAEFTGREMRAKRGGHIPGAVNLNWIDNLTKDDTAQFRPAPDLLDMYREAGVTRDKIVVAYCQSGMRASHTYFTLLLLGYPNVKIYDASWLKWGNREDLPIE